MSFKDATAVSVETTKLLQEKIELEQKISQCRLEFREIQKRTVLLENDLENVRSKLMLVCDHKWQHVPMCGGGGPSWKLCSKCGNWT